MASITTDQVRDLLEQNKCGRVTQECFEAFLRNPAGWTTDGIIEIELELTYRDRIVVELRSEGGPWVYWSREINDRDYPVEGTGTVKVKYRLVPGKLFKRDDDGYCYRSNFKEFCQARNWREANAAEALLLFAKDKQLGRGKHPVVAFIAGSGAAFVVIKLNPGRGLLLFEGDGPWGSSGLFLAVCE